MIHLCGQSLGPPGLPQDHDDDPEHVCCCAGCAYYGPDRCTCWQPVYDLKQQSLVEDAPTIIRTELCRDCAYRPGSPERSDPEEESDLMSLTYGSKPFSCHQGIRKVVKWIHPTGKELPADPRDYQPPQDGSKVFKADGTPADICAGWAKLAEKAGAS